MPRPSKGARLWLHPTERAWIIRDSPAIFRRTGCGESDLDGAQKELGRYLSEKFKPATRERRLNVLSVTETLIVYGREHAPSTKGSSPSMAGYNIAALLPFWASKKLSEVNKATCQAYTAQRCKTVKPSTARRELAILSAAIHYWNETYGPLEAVPVVTLPPKPPPRERWLTRSEAARLLAGALGFYQVFWTDIRTRRRHSTWRRYLPRLNRHLARFILLGLNTGSRKTSILVAQWMPNTTGGWVDLDRGVLHRRSSDEEETKKRRPPVRLGRRILAHLRRWHRLDGEARAAASEIAGEPVAVYRYIVTWEGQPVAGVRRSWSNAVELAWLDEKVTAHTMRHTRATWLMQAAIPIWEAAGALGMSVKMLEETYGHHHPDWQKSAAEV